MKLCVLLCSILLCGVAFGVGGDMGGGAGTEADPWLIEDFDDFDAITYFGPYWASVYNKHIKLVVDIDLDPSLPGRQAYVGSPIQGMSSPPYAFGGVFDGNGRAIKNLTIVTRTDYPSSDNIGLFGKISSLGSAVKNLKLEDVYIDVYSPSTVENIGGLCGVLYQGTIENCSVTGTIDTDETVVGGMCGLMVSGTIKNSKTSVTVSGQNNLGGFSGSTGGGLIENCYAKGEIIINGNGSYQNGGFIGYVYSSTDIKNCYSAVNFSSNTSAVGSGFIGRIDSVNSGYTIEYCYSVGKVIASSVSKGFVGRDLSGYPNPFSTCFWDVESSGYGLPGDTNYGASGRTTAGMRAQWTFAGSGWDFVGETANGTNDHWKIRDGEDYPRLTWQIEPHGDIAGTWGVDLIDLAKLSECWQCSVGQGCYDSVCDLDNTGASAGVIDLADLIYLTQNWLNEK